MAEPEANPASAEYGAGARFFYEIARTELNSQINAIDALDRKLASTFTLNGALIALIAAAFTLRSGSISPTLWGFLVAVVAIFLLNSLCTFLAYRLRRWRIGPDLSDFTEFAVEYETDAVVHWAASQIRASCAQNEVTLRRKATWVRYATALTMVDLCVAAIAAVIATWPW